MHFQRVNVQQDEQDKKNEMTQRTNKTIAGKIIPVEILDGTNEAKIMKVGEDEKKKIKKEEKKASAICLTRAKMLEMIAWYLVPAIYIIFTVAYFIIYLY